MDDKLKGELARQVLENEAFRALCEEENESLRKAFLSDDDGLALQARYKVKALESVLTKLTRWSQKGIAIRKRELEAQKHKERAES